MGRLYTVTSKAVAVSAQQDLLEILAPSDAAVIIHDWELNQNTELGDAAEEQLAITCNRGVGAVTSGSGGTSPAVQAVADGDPAFGGTIEANNTTKMLVGSGTLEELTSHNWNVRIPFQKIYTPETRPVISPGNRWTLELETTPADVLTVSVTATLEEVGG